MWRHDVDHQFHRTSTIGCHPANSPPLWVVAVSSAPMPRHEHRFQKISLVQQRANFKFLDQLSLCVQIASWGQIRCRIDSAKKRRRVTCLRRWMFHSRSQYPSLLPCCKPSSLLYPCSSIGHLAKSQRGWQVSCHESRESSRSRGPNVDHFHPQNAFFV